jgi:hypothetical protein
MFFFEMFFFELIFELILAAAIAPPVLCFMEWLEKKEHEQFFNPRFLFIEKMNPSDEFAVRIKVAQNLTMTREQLQHFASSLSGTRSHH